METVAVLPTQACVNEKVQTFPDMILFGVVVLTSLKIMRAHHLFWASFKEFTKWRWWNISQLCCRGTIIQPRQLHLKLFQSCLSKIQLHPVNYALKIGHRVMMCYTMSFWTRIVLLSRASTVNTCFLITYPSRCESHSIVVVLQIKQPLLTQFRPDGPKFKG